MPAKKTPVLEETFEEEIEDIDEFQDSPAEDFDSSLTVAVPVQSEKEKGPRVTVFLPKLLDDDNGVKVDQYEHVTIANERGEICYKVLRGEPVEVPISVFIVLKQKYPKI